MSTIGTQRGPGLIGSADASTVALVLVVLLTAIPAQLVVGPLGAAGTPAKLFGMAMFIWWLFTRVSRPEPPPAGSRATRLSLGFFAVSIGLAYVAAMSRPVDLLEMRGADRSLLTVMAWCGMALVIADGVRTRQRLEFLLRGIAVAGVAMAVVGLLQFYGLDLAGLLRYPGLVPNAVVGIEVRSVFARVQATSLHAIEFGVVLNLVLPLVLHFAFQATTRESRRRWWAAVVLTGAVIPMTVARSAMLGAAVVALVLLPSWPRERRRKAYLALAAGAVAMKFVVPGLIGTIRGLFTNIESDPSTQGRTADYGAVGRFVSEAPFFGRGMDTFLPTTYRTLDNQYLLSLVTTGVVGLLALLGVFAVAVWLMARVRTKSSDPATRDLAQCLMASVLAPAVTFATFDGLSFPICSSLLFVLIGCVGALHRLEQPPDEAWRQKTLDGGSARQSARLAAAVAAAVVAAGLVWLWPVVGRGTQYYASGAVLLSPDNYKANPYSYGLNVNALSELVARVVDSDDTRMKLSRDGARADYEVAIGLGSLQPGTDRLGLGPVVRFQAHAADPAMASRTRDALRGRVDTTLASLQSRAGAPRSTWIIAYDVVPPDAEPSAAVGRRSRALVLLLLLGAASWWIVTRLVGSVMGIAGDRGRQRTPSVFG